MRSMKIKWSVSVVLMLVLIVLTMVNFTEINSKMKVHMDGRVTSDSVSEYITNSTPGWQKYLCERRNPSLETESLNCNTLLFPSQETDLKPDENNIFLMESSCDPKPTYRAWCSVESWAAQNTNGHVYYVITSPFLVDKTGLVKSLVDTYNNLALKSFSLDHVFKSTPVEDFFSTFRWAKNKSWSSVVLSELLRVVLVWKFGGFYSDSDIICIQDVSGLRDVVGLEQETLLNSAHFHCRPEHPFLYKVMQATGNYFNPGVWGNLGPKLFTSMMAELCGTQDFQVKEDSEYKKCFNMTILPQKVFSPVNWRGHKDLIKADGWKTLEKTVNGSYAIHFFNHMIEGLVIKSGGKSVFDVVAKKYCPITYEYATAHSHYF